MIKINLAATLGALNDVSKLMLEESNFLIFDQPLDHLDSESIELW